MSPIEQDILEIIQERDRLREENEQLKLMLKVADLRIKLLVKERERCNADAGKKRHTLYK
jgi:hypothetical protein